MKRDFTEDNFDDFLKRSADGLRMKAPDKVWQNLSKELSKKRRRFTFGLSAFLLVSSAFGYAVISNIPQTELTTTAPSHQNNETPVTDETDTKNNKSTQTRSTVPVVPLQKPSVERSVPNENRTQARIIPFRIITNSAAIDNSSEAIAATGAPESENTFSSTVVDSYTEFEQSEIAKKTETEPAVDKSANELPLTIESVVNSFKSKNKKKKFESQLYFTPTISYRKLSENKSYLRSLQNSLPASLPAMYSSVNNNVTHKPDIGFEVGYTGKFLISKKLKIRTGLQFNVNRYDVKAFSSPMSVATIALNNGTGVQSLNTLSNYSNVQGYKSNWLQNLSFQLSAPIGAEFIISENDDMAFGFGTTIQPTYILGDRAYLITTDYKNYTHVPWLIRRWNVNTALEAFVNLQSGTTKWQIGPQVRYQLLSSFVSKYPVKENLFDFGLKVGVTLNNNR